MRMGAATPLTDLTEQEWDGQLFRSKKGLANVLGWTHYHTLRSRGSAPGFPDRTLWRDRVIFVELKREGGKPSDRQREILTGIARAGGECYLWRPSDLDEIATVLAKRWRFEGDRLRDARGDDAILVPRSLWLPAGHRNDEQRQEVIAAA
jgi:hypothetical protein